MKRPAICFCLCISILGWAGVGHAKGGKSSKTEAAPAAAAPEPEAAPAEQPIATAAAIVQGGHMSNIPAPVDATKTPEWEALKAHHDKLVADQPVMSARHTLRAPMSQRTGDRECGHPAWTAGASGHTEGSSRGRAAGATGRWLPLVL